MPVVCWQGASMHPSYPRAARPCSFPFLNLFFRRLGLGERAIGALGAARPLISLPAGALWSGAADKSRRHRAVLLGCFAASVVARLAIAPVGALWPGSSAPATAAVGDGASTGGSGTGRAALFPLLCMVLATEFFAAPVTIIVDAGARQLAAVSRSPEIPAFLAASRESCSGHLQPASVGLVRGGTSARQPTRLQECSQK